MPQTQTLERKLEVRTGPLAEIFPLFDSSTIQHSHEIITARRTDATLRNQWFWTADFPMYRIEDREAILYFAPIQHNLIFKDIQNATSQLIRNQNYMPTKEGIEEVVMASNTGAVLKVKLSDLRLQGRDDGWRYFDVNTGNPDSLNSAERTFAERVYGQGNEFVENMRTLNENGVTTTRLYVLNPNYVKSRVKGDGAIARASLLVRFDNVCRFNALEHYVVSPLNGLRGVLKRSAEGAAKIHNDVTTQYTAEGILNYLSANPIKDARFAASSMTK